MEEALRSSVILSRIGGRSATKVSSLQASISVAMRRRLSCVFRSASSRAEVAPTPKTIPAVVGGVMRASSSGILSLSVTVHCFRRGSQSSWTRAKLEPKKRESLNASATSFFHDFWLFGSLESS